MNNSSDIKLIPVNTSEEYYRVCKKWLENREITKWFHSALRFAKYTKIMHEMLILNKKNKIFFIDIEDKFIGLVGLINIDYIDKRAEIWVFIGSEDKRNLGIATKAMNLLKNYAVQELKLVTLYAKLAESNASSIRLMEKIGFQYVGKYRKAFFVEGSYKDLLIYDWVSPEFETTNNSISGEKI